jgi:hypothetical protein
VFAVSHVGMSSGQQAQAQITMDIHFALIYFQGASVQHHIQLCQVIIN